MKKYAFIFLTLTIIPFYLGAQDSSYFHVGFGGSINSVWIINQNIYGGPEIDYAPTLGGNIMLAAGYNFTPKSGLRLEPAYSWQGQSYEGDQTIDGTKYTATRDVRLNYFLIPVLYRYTTGAGNTKFNLMVGPQLGFLLDANQEYLRDGVKVEDPAGKEEIKDRFNSLDIMLVADVGAQISLTADWFMTAGFRVAYGLTDMNAEDWQLENLDGVYEASKNFTAGITIGINYKIGASKTSGEEGWQ